jgi:hypothetical protein
VAREVPVKMEKFMGKSWENGEIHKKIIGKSWENGEIYGKIMGK